MEVTIDLIRHAESAMNVDMADRSRVPFIGGRQNEVALTSHGEAQAAGLGRYAVHEGITPTGFHSSPAVRTVRTHEISSEVMGLYTPPTLDDRLQELDQGEWTNQPRSLYDEPDNVEVMGRQGSDFAPPGGESMNMVDWRVGASLDSIVAQYADSEKPEHIWVHTHGVAIKTRIGNLLGWTHEQIYKMAIDNASLTRVVNKNGLWEVVFVNQSSTEGLLL